jgi:CIC family chloride channel protein
LNASADVGWHVRWLIGHFPVTNRTAIFAIEVLYGEMEFESGALVLTMVGSIVAYAVNGFFVGFRRLFDVPSTLAAPGTADYGWYIVLGAAWGW